MCSSFHHSGSKPVSSLRTYLSSSHSLFNCAEIILFLEQRYLQRKSPLRLQIYSYLVNTLSWKKKGSWSYSFAINAAKLVASGRI